LDRFISLSSIRNWRNVWRISFAAQIEPGNYTLFETDELQRGFAGWEFVSVRRDGFDPPGGTRNAAITSLIGSRSVSNIFIAACFLDFDRIIPNSARFHNIDGAGQIGYSSPKELWDRVEQRQLSIGNLSGCGWPLKGCAVVTVVVIFALVGLLVYALMLPGWRDLRKCQANMTQINDALGRYYDVNGEYPPDLQTLAKEYLKDESVLRCPLSKPGKSGSSYIYNRPGPHSPGGFPVLVCECHSKRNDLPIRRLILLKNGQLKLEARSLKELELESRRKR